MIVPYSELSDIAEHVDYNDIEEFYALYSISGTVIFAAKVGGQSELLLDLRYGKRFFSELSDLLKFYNGEFLTGSGDCRAVKVKKMEISAELYYQKG